MNRLLDTFAAAAAHLETLHVRHDADVGVILVQVDQLARINNSAGTAAGDAVLDEVGRRLENFTGDEFGQGAHVDRLDGPRFLIVPPAALSLDAPRGRTRKQGRQRRVGTQHYSSVA